MIFRTSSSARRAGVAVIVGVLGACAVLVVLVEASGGAGPAPGAGTTFRSRRAVAAPQLTPMAMRTGARTGLRLMSEAVAACTSTSFHGTQVADWWGLGDTSSSVIQVWHQAGGAVVAEPASPAGGSQRPRSAEGQPEPGAEPGAVPDSGDVMTVTAPLLALMRENYLIAYDGRGAVDGRPAEVVQLTRPDGSLAAKFWLDTATRLPLRRELFDPSGTMFTEDAFTGIELGEGRSAGEPAAGAARPWTGQLSAAGRAALRADGWPLPGAAMGSLTLLRSAHSGSGTGKVIELSYSDGLSVISLFVQRGQLPKRLPGWRRVGSRGDSTLYAVDPDDRSLTWAAHGFVFTMISDAAADTVGQAMTALPYDLPAGFWDRMGRGFKRIVTWADPLH